MSTIPFVQIDAFASQPFEGNQACVMPLDSYLPDATLQSIAAENNVAETAFVVAAGDDVWELRWFTPTVEVPLCGHATLAAGHYLYSHGGFDGDQITFQTRQSGDLFVSRLADGRLEMDFPAQLVEEVSPDAAISEALGGAPIRAFAGPCYVALYETAAEISEKWQYVRHICKILNKLIIGVQLVHNSYYTKYDDQCKETTDL